MSHLKIWLAKLIKIKPVLREPNQTKPYYFSKPKASVFFATLPCLFFVPRSPMSISHRFLLLILFLFIWPFNSVKPTSWFWKQTLGLRSWWYYRSFTEVKNLGLLGLKCGICCFCMRLRFCSFTNYWNVIELIWLWWV